MPTISGKAHLWVASLNLSAPEYHQLYEILSPDEHERASAFIFEKDRHHFVAARGFLRILLGYYVKKSPSQLVFAYGKQGKPYLPAHKDLHFNLSHAHGKALYGIANRPIGVDMEHISALEGFDKIAFSYFTDVERQLLATSHPKKQHELFLHMWTRKEAYLKMKGEGLTSLQKPMQATPTAACAFTFAPAHNYIATVAFEPDPECGVKDRKNVEIGGRTLTAKCII
jgi:4'-phosphopantetheinyl transferase